MYAREAREVIESSLYGGQPPTRRSLHLLERLRPAAIRSSDDGNRLTVVAGMLMARMRADELADGLALAENLMTSRLVLLDRPDAVLGALSLEAALSETYIAAGGEHPTLALEHANAAAGLAEEVGDPRWRYRSIGLQAAATALSGDLVAAEALLAEMSAIVKAQGWDPDRAEFMGAVAEGLIALTRLDLGRLDRLAPRLQALLPTEPSARALADLVRLATLMFSGQLNEALALATLLAQGATQPNGPSLIRDIAVMIHASLLVARGEPARALGTLSGRESGSSHFVCLGTVRGSAYLQLRDYRSVLRATDSCMRVRVVHNLWALPQVLIRRAIANLRLGNEGAGLNESDDAMHLLKSSDPGMALFLLPLDEIRFLTEYLRGRGRSPDPRLERIVGVLSGLDLQSPEVILPVLSRREAVVAGHLRSSSSFKEIAAQLHVSPSTVKTQALAIYKKLQVSSREDAVLHLERGGFYDM